MAIKLCPELGRVLQAIAHRNGLHRDGFPVGRFRTESSSYVRGWVRSRGKAMRRTGKTQKTDYRNIVSGRCSGGDNRTGHGESRIKITGASPNTHQRRSTATSATMVEEYRGLRVLSSVSSD